MKSINETRRKSKYTFNTGSLNEALKNLSDDHEYLLKGDVFTEDVIETWIKYKIDKEIKPMSLQPHPFEFSMYFDV